MFIYFFFFFFFLRIFYRSLYRCTGLRHFVFLFVWNFLHSIGIFFFVGRKCIDLVLISNEGRHFCGVSTNSQKLCLQGLFRPLKLVVVNFPFLSNFVIVCFFLYIFFISKSFYVMFMSIPWHLLERYMVSFWVFVDRFLRKRLV